MKFKRVEIQAFRAYRDVKDGTFDFMTASNEVADFISIYAPNGFGKSSFFDAIEWGFTQNVERLLRKDRFRKAKATDSHTTVPNRETPRDGKEGLVRLYVTTESAPIERKIPTARPRQLDTGCIDNKTAENRNYFRGVIWAQERIDALLKEDDESARYEKYVEAFGDANLDGNYKLLTAIIKHNNSKIDALKQELQSVRAKNDFDCDPEILSKINTAIAHLDSQGEPIQPVRFDWTEKQVCQLADLISERTIEIRYAIRKEKEKINTVHAVITALESDYEHIRKGEFEKWLADVMATSQKKMSPMEALLQSFEKTKAYLENVRPFLKQEAFSRKESALLEEITFLAGTVAPVLEQERRVLAETIAKQIESTFHGKLINKLYKKIDTQPDYKDIAIISDFTGDKPRLNILVPEENDDLPIIPSVYFSAPQLNILSLSIFLAKALRAKDDDGNPVDCIFIDDPIQSMDSIHVLSTIDLLRSFLVRTGKQMIFSTHDENIHQLLQRKIPPEKFRAKYIELETFGKVKQ